MQDASHVQHAFYMSARQAGTGKGNPPWCWIAWLTDAG